MQYFKTLGGALTYQFEQDGMLSDNGEPIKATEKPMSEKEFVEYKEEEIYNKTQRLFDRNNVSV